MNTGFQIIRYLLVGGCVTGLDVLLYNFLTGRREFPRGYADHLLQLFILYWFLGSFYIVWRDWLSGQETELGRQPARASASL